MRDAGFIDLTDIYGHRQTVRDRWVDPMQTRTRSDYPYSYDEFFLWGDRETKAGKSVVYSDRLRQWDRDKALRCFEAVGRRGEECWRGMSQEESSRWLTLYHGRPITAVALAEGCNVSNGYPYWVIWFSDAVPPQPRQDEEGRSA